MNILFKKNCGFTLLELIASLSIIAILVGIAVPSFSYIIEKHKSDAAISDIYEMYQLGRSYAVSEKTPVYFCGSNSAEGCDREFNKHLLLFIDKDGDKKPSTAEIIHQKQLAIGESVMRMRAAFGRRYTMLSPSGSASLTGSVVYCPPENQRKYANKVTWNRAGRPYRGQDLDNDGIIDGLGKSKTICD